MPGNILTKRCPKCKTGKVIANFHKDRSKKDGYHAICTQCVRRYKEIYSRSAAGKLSEKRRGKRKRAKAPEKVKARAALNYAVLAGKLPSPSRLKCNCGEDAANYHHIDYFSKDGLNVVPVCQPCHRKLHRE